MAILISTNDKISHLLDIARHTGESLTWISVQPEEGMAAESLAFATAGHVERLLKENSEHTLILAADTPACRVIAGAVAATQNLPVLHTLTQAQSSRATLSRFGGLREETVSWEGVALACIEGGKSLSEEERATLTCVTVTSLEDPAHTIRISRPAENDGTDSDITTADRIVCAGRGFENEEDLDLARSFATALGADLACTRPLAEGSHWMSRDTYIGVSGQSVAPTLYVGVGVSGQVQHTVGIENAQVIVAINNDPESPIFAMADYGIVGDLYAVLPEFIQQLQA